ncbi:MAG: ion transporter [Ferruginibacter sp.]
MYYKAKKHVHSLLHPELGVTKWVKLLNGFIIILIILNVAAVMLETVHSIYQPYKSFFRIFDLSSVIFFTIEYVLRVWSCNHDPRYAHSIRGRFKYMMSPGAIIDLLAILPFYVHVVSGLDLRILRMLRLLRFLRLFRLTAYMKSARLITNVFKTRANELKLSLILILFLIVMAACLVYFAEHQAQPEVFSSIPATIWWAIISITTVGYGDMIPITLTGKIITSLISMMSLAILALPAGIITSGFLEESRKLKKDNGHVCPHCGNAHGIKDTIRD